MISNPRLLFVLVLASSPACFIQDGPYDDPGYDDPHHRRRPGDCPADPDLHRGGGTGSLDAGARIDAAVAHDAGGGWSPAHDGGVTPIGTGLDAGGSKPLPAAGSCTSDAMCGGGLVCDRALGACATPHAGCGSAAFTPTSKSGDVVLVLDRSISMQDATTTGTKWTDLGMAVDGVLAQRADIAWGLELFPAADTHACMIAPLAVAPGSGTSATIAATIHATTPSGSGTPTRDAVLRAGQEMLASSRATRKYVLLATDGEPNCSGTDDPKVTDVAGTTAAVRSLAAQGVTTFVLGFPANADSHAALEAVATAGGHARQGMTAYYTARDASELERTIGSVARQIALCTFDLSPPPPAGTTVTLSIGGRTFARNTSHAGDGWDVTAAGRAIELYGAACDAIQAGASVQLQYGCPPGSTCDAPSQACVEAGIP